MKRSNSATVLYAIDGNPRYHQMVLLSVESLRYYSPHIPIKVCVFGKMASRSKLRLKKYGAEVVMMPIAGSLLRWGLKWLALRTVMEFNKVLFVDADTCFFGPVETLFNNHTESDFYAIEEFGTNPKKLRSQNLKLRVKPQILKKLRKQIGAEQYPLFNSSLMLFNRGSHRIMVQRLPLLLELIHDFSTRKRELPMKPKWRFMAEEVAGSLVLAQRPAVSFSFWNPLFLTHYNRWIESGRGPIGTFMHIGNGHYPLWMEEFFEVGFP